MNEKVNCLKQKLEDGVREVFESGRLQDYLDFCMKFHNYSVNNQILIMRQKPTATQVAGYKKWQTDFERNVKKGERGIVILRPNFKKYKEKNKNGEEVERTIPYYTTATVFDISQTTGKEVPTLCENINKSVENFSEMWNALVNIAEFPVAEENISDGCRGYFSHNDGRIVVEKNMSEADKIKTLVHELAHSILHYDTKEKYSRQEKETQAESVAYIVSNYFGIDTDDYSFEYVAAWSRDKETKVLQKYLELIQKTANNIIEKIEREVA